MLGYMLFRAWHWLSVFLRLTLVKCFPSLALVKWHWLNVFPCFTLIKYFPALNTGYVFARALHWLHVFSRLTLVKCFPALGTCFIVLNTG